MTYYPHSAISWLPVPKKVKLLHFRHLLWRVIPNAGRKGVISLKQNLKLIKSFELVQAVCLVTSKVAVIGFHLR